MPLGCEEFFLCSSGGKQHQRIINHHFRMLWFIVELSWVMLSSQVEDKRSMCQFLNIALLRVLLGIIVQLLRRSAGSHPLTHKFITWSVFQVWELRHACLSLRREWTKTSTPTYAHTIIPTLWLSMSLPFPCCLRLLMSSHVQWHVRLMNYCCTPIRVYYPSVSRLKKTKVKHRQQKHKLKHSGCTKIQMSHM